MGKARKRLALSRRAKVMLHWIWQMNSAGAMGHGLIVWLWRLKALGLELIIFTGINRMSDRAAG